MGIVRRKKPPTKAEIQQAQLAAAYSRTGGAYEKVASGSVTYDARGQAVPLYRQTKVSKVGGSSRYADAKYERTYDQGWDDYNKALRETRNRVSPGVRKRRKTEVGARVDKFRAGTLLGNLFDEE